MASRLADILQQEYKTKGLIGGTASAAGKKTLEKIDLRNVLFGGSGISSIVGRKVFGRGYSATSGSNKVSGVSESISSGSSSVLQEISINGRISAKNSMALPRIAEQMNIMQKNVAKLVRLQGGTPSTKAQNYFSGLKMRENAYEASLNKRNTSPTQITSTDKKDNSLGLMSILGLVGGTLLLFGDKLNTTTKIIGGVLVGLVALKAILGVLTAASIAKGLIPGAKRIGKKTGRGKGALAALALGGILGYNYLSEDDENISNEESLANKQMSGLGGVGTNLAVTGGAIAAQKFINPSLNAKTQAKIGGPIGFNEKASRFTQNNTFKSAKNLPLSKTLEKLRTFYVNISKTPGLRSFVLKKLVSKFGIGLTLRLSVFLAGLAAAPFTAGLSSFISLASFGLTAYALYDLYDFLFGPEDGENNLIKAFEVEQKASKSETEIKRDLSPTPQAGTPEAIIQQSFLGGQQQTAATMGGGEFTPDMLAATGVNQDQVGSSSTTPTQMSGDSQKVIEEYLGRPITPEEYDMLMRAVYAESSRNKDEYANVMAVILNRTRKRGGTIGDTLMEKNQFQAVTGPGSTANFQRGPDASSLSMINQSTSSLSKISKNLDSFTAANPDAYKDVGGISKYNKKMAEMNNNSGKQIGQTIFAENLYRPGSAPTTTASVRRPTGLNSYSVALNNKANSQMPMTNINNINQTNASSTPPAVKPSSAYDVQIATLLLGLAT